MDQSLATSYLEEVNERIGASELLKLLGYATDKIQVVGDSVKAFCPIHRDAKFRSLVIDTPKHSFRCTLKSCRGASGGTLVELYALTNQVEPITAAARLISSLKLDVDPGWSQRLGAAQFDAARQLLEGGDLEGAEEAVRTVLAFQPNSPEARLLLASIHAHRGDSDLACHETAAAVEAHLNEGHYGEADRLLEEAAGRYPDSEDLFFLQVRSAELQGRTEAVVELLEGLAAARDAAGRALDNFGLYQKLIELQPDNPSPRLRLAALYESRHDMRTACRELEKAATLLVKSQRGGEAVPILEKILRTEPQQKRLRLMLADEQIRDGNYPAAKEQIFQVADQEIENSEFVAAEKTVRRWLDIEPESVETYEYLARIFQEQERHGEAADALLQASQIAGRAGGTEASLPYLFRVKFLQPENIDLRRTLVEQLLAQKEPQRAGFELLDLAEVLYHRGLTQEAEGELRRAAEVDPAPAFRLHVADILVSHAQPEAAWELYSAALSECEASGDLETAAEACDRMVALRPEDLSLARRRTALLWQAAMPSAPEATADLLHRLLESGQDSGEALQVLRQAARCDAGLQVPPSPFHAELFDRAAELQDAETAAAFYGPAVQALAGADPHRALACATRMIALDPAREQARRDQALLSERVEDTLAAAEAWTALARLEEERGDYEAAVEDLDRALQLRPDRYDALKHKALILETYDGAYAAAPVFHQYLVQLRTHAPAEFALAEHEAYLAQHSADNIARRHLADLFAATGERDKAAGLYQELVAAAESADDVVEVLHLRERQLELEPDNPVVQVALASALVEAGDSTHALELFKAAAENFIRRGGISEAALAVSSALQINPADLDLHKLHVEAAIQQPDTGVLEQALLGYARALQEQKLYSEAISPLRDLLGLSSTTEYRSRLAEVLDLAGQADEAAAEWKAVASEWEAAGQARAALDVYARLAERLCEDLETLTVWNRLSESRSATPADRAASTAALAIHYLAQGDFTRGAATVDLLLKAALKAPAEAAPLLGRVAARLGNNPRGEEVYLAASRSYVQAGFPESAIELLLTGVNFHFESSELRLALAELYETTQNPDEAFEQRLQVLGLSLRADAGSTRWKSQLNEIRKHYGTGTGRRLAVVKVLAAGEKSEEIQEEIAGELKACLESARAQNSPEVVLEICDAAPEAAALEPQLRTAKTEVLMQGGRSSEAAAWLRYCSQIALAAEQVKSAEEAVARWQEIAPSDPEAMETAAALHLRAGNKARALECTMSAARIWQAAGEAESAARALCTAVELDGDNLAPRQMLWHVLLESGKKAAAAEEMVSAAEMLDRTGQTTDAVALLKQVLEIEPEHVGAVGTLARFIYRSEGASASLPHFRRMLLLRRRFDRAQETAAAYEKVVELEGMPVELRVEYAAFLEETGQEEKAKQQLLRTAEIYRDELKDLVRSIEFFGRATALFPAADDARVFEDVAALHLELKVPAFAGGALREAARLYDLSGKSAAAVQCARQAVALSEGAQKIEDLALLGTLLFRSGKATEGAENLRAAVQLADDGNIPDERKRELCSALLDADPSDYSVAERYLGLLPPGEIPECAVALAQRFEGSGHRLDLLRLARKLAPSSVRVRQEIVEVLAAPESDDSDSTLLQVELTELCEAAISAGDREAASQALEQLERLPGSTVAPLTMARLYARTGDGEKAALRYSSAAEQLTADGDIESAADALQQALQADAAAVPAASVATMVRQSKAAPALRAIAEHVLETAIRARSRTRALVIGTALLEQVDRDEGREILRRIASGAGASFVVAVAGAHAEWLFERDFENEASALAEFVTVLVPNSPDAWWLASQLQRKTGDAQGAASSAMKAARLYNEAGAVTEEESCYREALEQFPDDIPVLETLAFFYDREKRGGDAQQVMQRLTDLTEKAGDFHAAAGWARKILSLAPQNDSARQKFAELLLKQNRTEEAAAQLLELGRSYAKRGEESKAEQAYAQLLEIEPASETAAAYLLDLATRRGDEEGVKRYTIAVAVVKAESGALNQACQTLRNLLIRDPDNLPALEKLAEFARRSQDDETYRSATLSLGQKLLKAKDTIGAILQFEALLDAEPFNLDVLQMLVECCAAEKMVERGADFAQQLLERSREVADMRRVVMAANAILAYDPSRAAVRREMAEAQLCLNRIPDAIKEWTRAAEEFVAAGDLAGAAECYRRVTQVAPGDLAIWKRLADILSFSEEVEEARAAYLHLAGAYAAAGDDASATAVLHRMADVDPDDPCPHEKLLTLHLHTENRKEAIEEILWLVRHRIRGGDLAAAERLVEQGVEIDPESLTLQQCRLEIVRGLGRHDELRLRMQELAERFRAAGDLRKAADTLEEILEIDPNQSEVRREVGALWIELKEPQKAYQHYARVLQETLERSDPEEARDTADTFLKQNDDVALRATLARVFTENGLQDLGGRYYAVCAANAAEAGDKQAQFNYLQLATQARPRWTEGLRQLAEASAEAGDTACAYSTYQRLSVLLTEAKQFPEAAEAIRRLVSLRPKDPDPRIQLAELYLRIGDRENRGAALQGLADLYISRGQTDEAVEVYRQLIELRPDDPEILQRFVELFAQVGNELEIVDEYLRLAEALTKKGAFVEATQTYEQILAIDRRNPVIREKFIAFLQNHGQKGRALTEMRRLADTYVGRGNRTSAVNVLVNALAMSPRDAELCLRLAAAYEAAGNTEAATQTYARAASLLADTAPIRAIDLYNKMLDKDPNNSELRRRLAEAYARANEQSRAASQARHLAELHAARGELDQAEAAYKLASANKKETLTALRRAVDQHSHNPMLQYVDLRRLADALMENGQTDEALAEYRKARELHDDDPVLIQKCIDAVCQIAPETEAIPDMLALAERYLLRGDATEARGIYERVMGLDPECEVARRGREEAIRCESPSGVTRQGSGTQYGDAEPVRPAKAVRQARVGMNDLLGALDDKPVQPE